METINLNVSLGLAELICDLLDKYVERLPNDMSLDLFIQETLMQIRHARYKEYEK